MEHVYQDFHLPLQQNLGSSCVKEIGWKIKSQNVTLLEESKNGNTEGARV